MKEQTKHTVWFGNMENIRFTVGDDEFDAIIVHQIALIRHMTEQEADEFMWASGYDSYLIPDNYEGEILFSHKEKRSHGNENQKDFLQTPAQDRAASVRMEHGPRT